MTSHNAAQAHVLSLFRSVRETSAAAHLCRLHPTMINHATSGFSLQGRGIERRCDAGSLQKPTSSNRHLAMVYVAGQGRLNLKARGSLFPSMVV